jgi:hypothetical protein
VTIVFAESPLHRSVRRCSFLSVTPASRHRASCVKMIVSALTQPIDDDSTPIVVVKKYCASRQRARSRNVATG